MTDVPGHHKATIDIAMAVAELPALLDSVPGMAWLADADGSRTYVAPAWLDFTGRREAEELGDGWADSLSPEDRERCRQIVRAAVRSRQVFSIEYRCLRHDGEYRWVLDTGVPRFGPSDELQGYVGSRVDITKRKQAEASLARAQTELEALPGRRGADTAVKRSAVSSEVNERRRVEDSERESESEWKFQQLATNIREVFWIAEAGKGLHYLSPAYEEIWGRPIAAAYGIPGGWLRWVHPEDRERVKDALEQWWDGEFAEVEYRISRPDGTERWIWDRGYPVSASAGEPRLITGIAEDITERKHRELALQLTQTSVDRAAYAVYWIDAVDARLVYVNDAAVSALGYTSDEL